jgi:hypothetical protein
MAFRVTQEDVDGILERQDGTNGIDIPLDPFIRQANVLTNWLASVDTSSELDEDTLISIELNLAAHFYSVLRDPRFQSKATGGASSSFQGATSFSLQASHYGQTAMLLDITGKLTKRNLEAQQGKRVASVTWLGWQDHSEDPYTES